ncbi:glycosyltransferase family 1 protein [Longimicrobium sp.]|uniref:glycosyltransferase family 4 protein n=1 Tax=Longimicrobium sp. TaxID=2029185 RepID=UPI002E2EAE91|nr:glycosyltransferase family 1 protein [Longimicrobium sp.]HEX6039889.1 glycosyltransferase family 1 protein [Longimicrobium sp.]
MKVVYFTESLLPHVDGVSRTLAQLFGFLEQRGVDFRVYSPFVPGPEISWSGRVRPVRFVRFPLYPDYRVSSPFGRAVWREVEEWTPDLVHVVSPTPMASKAQKWAAKRGVPVVSSFHTHFVSYFRYYGAPWAAGFGWRMLKRFYDRCERVYVPTYAIIDELREHGITNTELWSRGIDLARFSPEHRSAELRAQAGADESTPILLMVSRLVKEKDMADLVEMERVLRSRGNTHRLVLVGDGPMRGELQAALPDAYFAGHQSGEALARWYASGDVFVFPSTTETFGNVVLEAQASGLPAVVVDRGGPPDLVQPGQTGFIARGNDPADLAEKCETLLRDPERRARMGMQAREAARERDWAAINGRLIESYGTIVDQHRRTSRP